MQLLYSSKPRVLIASPLINSFLFLAAALDIFRAFKFLAVGMLDPMNPPPPEPTVMPPHTVDPLPAGRYRGVCKWFQMARGFGFIAPEDGQEDIFFHQRDLKLREGWTGLAEGENVEFSLEADPSLPPATISETQGPGNVPDPNLDPVPTGTEATPARLPPVGNPTPAPASELAPVSHAAGPAESNEATVDQVSPSDNSASLRKDNATQKVSASAGGPVGTRFLCGGRERPLMPSLSSNKVSTNRGGKRWR